MFERRGRGLGELDRADGAAGKFEDTRLLRTDGTVKKGAGHDQSESDAIELLEKVGGHDLSPGWFQASVLDARNHAWPVPNRKKT